MKKKIASLFLALALCVGLAVPALADDSAPDSTPPEFYDAEHYRMARKEISTVASDYTSTSKVYFSYNEHGDLIEETWEDSDGMTGGGTYSYTYDAAGRVLTKTTGEWGFVYTYTYDAAGNMLSEEITTPFETGTSTWTYDSKGNVLTYFDGADTTTYTYDAAGNLTKKSKGRYTTTYTYDAQGKLLTETYTVSGIDYSRVVTYTYNSQGQCTQKADGITTTTYTYDANGNTITEVADSPSVNIKTTTTYTYVEKGSAPAVSGSPFTDVSADKYYYESVLWAVDEGITNGTTATTFSPNNTCTKAQIITFLYRAAGSPSVSVSNPFNDVSESVYYYDAARWAYSQGMVAGDSFTPNVPCTRAMVVEFMWKQAGSPSASSSASFTDVSSGASYAPAVSWALEQGVTNGTTATTFSPDTTCTRGQIVTFLYRGNK